MAEAESVKRQVSAGRQEAMPDAAPAQVKTSTVTSPAGFGEAYASAAMQPTALGMIGATVAQSASTALAQKRGQTLGQNPVGDIYPPITEADKTYANAYNAQASATLGLQAQDLMYKSQEEMDKATKLNPGMIQEYKKNVSQGLSDLLQLAPTASKTNLEQQFGHALLSSTHQYTEKLISQQKSDQLQTAQAGISTSTTAIYDQWMSGQTELADKTFKGAMNAIEANVASGVLTKSQAVSAKTQLSTTYNGTKVGSMLLNAKTNGNLPEALDGLNKGVGTEGLTPTERDAANSYGFKMLATSERYSAENQQAKTAYAAGLIDTGQMTNETMDKLQTELSPVNYIKTQTKYLVKLQKEQKTNQVVSELASNLSDIDLISAATDKQKDQAAAVAANNLVLTQKQNGKDLSIDDAQLLVGKEAAAEIPFIKKKVELGLLSRDPGEVFKASQVLDSLNEDGNAFYKINDSTLARAEVIKLATEAGQTPEEANKIGDSLQRITPDEKASVREQVGYYGNKNWTTEKSTFNWAVDVTGTGSSLVRDKAAFSNQAKFDFSKWMLATHGNVDASLNLLKRQHNRSWGKSNTNGVEETMLYPPEMISNLGDSSSFLWQDQIHNQVQVAFASGKEMFDSGGTSSYFRVSERESVESYIEKAKSGKIPWSPFTDKFIKGSTVKVVKYYKGGDTKQMHLEIIPNMTAQITEGQKGKSLDMSYTIMAVDDATGVSESIPYFHGKQHTSARFRPDIEKATLHFNQLHMQITGKLNSEDYVKQRNLESSASSMTEYRKALLLKKGY